MGWPYIRSNKFHKTTSRNTNSTEPERIYQLDGFVKLKGLQGAK